MNAGLCACGNAARYINERGELCCAICPLKEGIDSIKLASVPELLAWARAWSRREPDYTESHVFRAQAQQAIRDLRNIVQRRPAPRVFAAPAPLVITNVEQLLHDETYLPYVPTAADGHVIGAPLASRLDEPPKHTTVWDVVVAVTESKP